MKCSSSMSEHQHMFCDITNPPQGLGEKTYENAILLLKSLDRKNFYINLTKEERHIYDTNKLPMVNSCLKSLGILPEKLDTLSIIHVTGTKGKGSTCTYTEEILRSKRYRTGLFTSPHIFDERDRIQIDGKCLSKEKFRNYVWHCFDTIKKDHYPALPNFFQLMTVMAFYIFLKENVDVVVLEVGIGGKNDCTNVIRNPVACGVTYLDIDHIVYLGDTIEKIAWHKAGIFKQGATAITVLQQDVALKVFCDRASEIMCSLYLAPRLQNYSTLKNCQILEEREDCELENMSLAIQLARVWIQNHNKAASEMKWVNPFKGEEIPEIDKDVVDIEDYITILESVKLPGRLQIFTKGNITYYMDGAHTNGSMECCCSWFKKKSEQWPRDQNSNIKKALLFTVSGKRKPKAMMEILKKCHFDLAMFVSNRLQVDDQTDDASQYNDLMMTWTSLFENETSETKTKFTSSDAVKGFSCISNALEWCQLNMANIHNGNPCVTTALKGATHLQILITGSLYLVGDVLKSLKKVN
ncbi:folylpolyglutamate synthase, mitochondrial isoform X1 [Octopus vulgaris]|uniref:tetrahydrofolate synthase n=1 Tax=Octopus vulgaris TaxID=6645 RepID=A0AA36EXB5_OCTVU|nr:folylpolyglutamate synthase, mitochondrial isoform X1 [Octopus vulgaris]